MFVVATSVVMIRTEVLTTDRFFISYDGELRWWLLDLLGLVEFH